ncbi:NAD-dependent epimerase/dehydratase family protein [Echinicola soli]|uniref:NAD-dependent epimerase/dehydratase family protein n=1 Tax=Echinicola soli TaxID=2591634 RepID=A0A514CD02_9BACT|nr:NAD-dependent epimerase/dehydratase family protein [Echinicola soli]QDH77689.1 NAD-dependent epimerase/dehydratase family protein [Echinicola soli]
MQTILGSGGVIANELAKELSPYTTELRLVSRHPQKVNPNDHTFAADLTNAAQVNKAVAGSHIVYLTAGLKYKTRLWENAWPKIMSNVLQACIRHQCKLVFFDNVYMYDPNYIGQMTENTPVRPVSRKGAVRAKIADMLLEKVEKGELQAQIARSADFYGPHIKLNSLLTELVFKPMATSGTAKWLSNAHQPHAFTFTPDAGKALALLGNTEDAYNQVWHLPTASNPPTGKEWIYLIAKELGKTPKHQVLPPWFFAASGWFVPFMRELKEMLYQYDRPYVFDSTKFQENFFFKPTKYKVGIKKIIETEFST